MMDCRVLSDESGDGPTNMAIDECLLESVADDPSRAAFRTYGWTVPTLSLGYFQPIAATEDPRWRGVPVVRRPTGGGALWHHHEITYALIVPRGHPLARRSADLYQAVHAAIARLLSANGLTAERRGETDRSSATPFLCFLDRDSEDVVSGGVKLVGSAQRRRAGAVLQHGSLLLARSEMTPELPGASDLARLDANPANWAERLTVLVTTAIEALPVPDRMTDSERRIADRLADEVYRNPSWTGKR